MKRPALRAALTTLLVALAALTGWVIAPAAAHSPRLAATGTVAAKTSPQTAATATRATTHRQARVSRESSTHAETATATRAVPGSVSPLSVTAATSAASGARTVHTPVVVLAAALLMIVPLLRQRAVALPVREFLGRAARTTHDGRAPPAGLPTPA